MERLTESQVDLLRRGSLVPERAHHVVPNSHVVEGYKNASLSASWGILRKHRWPILLIFTIVLAGAEAWTFSRTPLYRAQGLVEIERETPHILTAQDLFELNSVSDVYLETQYKILESDSLAEQVMKQLELAKLPESASSRTRPTWPTVRAILGLSAALDGRTQADPVPPWTNVDTFRKHLQITPVRHSRLVQVSFDAVTPDLARRVVNAFVAAYIDQDTQARRNESRKATGWLSRQLADVRVKLLESENKLQNYAQGKGLLLPEVGSNGNETLVSDRLRRYQEELTKAQADRNGKESLYRLVQAGDYASLPGVFDNKLIQDLSVQLAELQKQAALLKTTFSPQYFKVKEIQNEIAELEAALSRERNRAAQRIVQEHTAAVNHENLARQEFEQEAKQANVVAEQLTPYNRMKIEADANRKLYDDLLQRVKQAEFSAQGSTIRVVDPGRAGPLPVTPRVSLNLALGALLGLVLGVGFAFVRDSMDNTVTNPEQVAGFLSLPTLATVPTIGSLNDRTYIYKPALSRRPEWRNGNYLAASAFPNSSRRISSDAEEMVAPPEAFRSLCTSMLFSDSGPVPSTILVTSAQPGEGKTLVATNLAIALAELGQPVLLIDADMRRPKIHRAFGVRCESGLVAYLEGEYDWRAVVKKTGIGGLDILGCGSQHPNPVQLLSSKRVPKLLAEATQEYKYVILDSPPVLNLSDGRILAHLVEGVILVVKSGATPLVLVQRAESYIRGTGAKINGVVLNNFNFAHDAYYSGQRHPPY